MAGAADGDGFRRLDPGNAAINGSEAFVAAGKFVEIGALMLCAVYVSTAANASGSWCSRSLR